MDVVITKKQLWNGDVGMYTGEDDVIFLTSLEGIHTCHLKVLERKEGVEREIGRMDKARKRGREARREARREAGRKGGRVGQLG